MSRVCHHLHQGGELGHGDLLGPLHRHGHLLLVLPVEEGQHLSDDRVQPLADLGLLVHLNVEAVGHLVILQRDQINGAQKERRATNFRSSWLCYNLTQVTSTYHYVVPLHFCFILSKFFAFKFQSRKREVV